MSKNSTSEDDVIHLNELFGALWAHKILIACITSLSLAYAGHFALTSQKKFTARAVFQINQTNNNSGFSIPSDLGALASLAGFSGGNSKSNLEALLERVQGREFILSLSTQLSLYADPNFNSYDPNYKEPFWKATIKEIIGWQKTTATKDTIVESSIIQNFRKNIQFEETDSGAISISATHADAKKAPFYANSIMEKVRQLVEDESNVAQNVRLSYLSETLADALQEVEVTQKNLKDYALKNSAMAQENFISDSLRLDEIRMEKRKVEEIGNLLSILQSIIKSKDLDGQSYEKIRLSHPLVDDIEFRRILGMSETISAWTWPDISTIDAVSATLRDRIKRLNVNISKIEENAKIYATSAEDLAKFTRDAKIAEATYTVLIEQVKSQSLAAGFQPDTFKVFEYATPPLAPSSPNRNFILAFGVLFGAFIGCFVALINSMRRGVYYTRSALLSNVNAELSLRSKSIRRLSRKSFSQIASFLSKQRIIALDEAEIRIANKKLIYIINSGGRPSASDTARLLATKSAVTGRNVVLFDTTSQSDKGIQNKLSENNSDLSVVKLGDNINVMTGADGASIFTSTKLSSTIEDLTKRFDQVFLCSSNSNTQLGLMALAEFNPSLVMISSLRKTKKIDIERLKNRQPIDLLFYD